MDIKIKMNARFKDLQGGLFLNVSKADVGEGASVFQKAGGDVMAWADMFYPDPSIPESVKKATMEAVKGGFPSHYTLPVGMYELRCALAEHIHERTGLAIDPSRNVIVTPGSDSGLLFAMMPFLEAGDEVLVPAPSYPSNYLNCKLLGAKAVHVPTWYDDNYRIHMGVLNDAGLLDYLADSILQSKAASTERGAELICMLGISLTTILFGGVTSASILTFGPILNRIGSAKNIHPYRRANLLDGTANSLPAIVPFMSVFVFIGAALTGLSPVEVAGGTVYAFALFGTFLVAVITGWGRKHEDEPAKK